MNNKFLKHNVVPFIFPKITHTLLHKMTRVKVIYPYYHMVSDDEVLHVKHLYKYKNIRSFKKDIDYLLKNYSPMNLYNLQDFLKKGISIPEKSFFLSFDDGFREMYDIVYPILKKKGVPATFFITSSFTDNKQLCYQHKASLLIDYFQKNILKSGIIRKVRKTFSDNNIELNNFKSNILSIKYQQKNIIDEIATLIGFNFADYLSNYQPYLSSDQIRELIENGFSIGAHSIDHPLFSDLTPIDQMFQLNESIKFIKETFILPYNIFAFPHTDNGVSKKFFSTLFNYGLIDILFGTSGMTNDIFLNSIQRISFEKPLISAEKIIALHFAKKIYRILRKKDKIIRNDA